MYLTTEQFTNEVINSIRYDKMIDLRKRYRNVDMLMIDDIQFPGRKGTHPRRILSHLQYAV